MLYFILDHILFRDDPSLRERRVRTLDDRLGSALVLFVSLTPRDLSIRWVRLNQSLFITGPKWEQQKADSWNKAKYNFAF